MNYPKNASPTNVPPINNPANNYNIHPKTPSANQPPTGAPNNYSQPPAPSIAPNNTPSDAPPTITPNHPPSSVPSGTLPQQTPTSSPTNTPPKKSFIPTLFKFGLVILIVIILGVSAWFAYSQGLLDQILKSSPQPEKTLTQQDVKNLEHTINPEASPENDTTNSDISLNHQLQTNWSEFQGEWTTEIEPVSKTDRFNIYISKENSNRQLIANVTNLDNSIPSSAYFSNSHLYVITKNPTENHNSLKMLDSQNQSTDLYTGSIATFLPSIDNQFTALVAIENNVTKLHIISSAGQTLFSFSLVDLIFKTSTDPDSINLIAWSQNPTTLWGSTQKGNFTGNFFSLNTQTKQAVKYSLPNGGGDYVYHLNTKLPAILFANYTQSTNSTTHLKLIDLSTDKVSFLFSATNHDFNPSWVTDTQIRFNNPQTNLHATANLLDNGDIFQLNLPQSLQDCQSFMGTSSSPCIFQINQTYSPSLFNLCSQTTSSTTTENNCSLEFK